MLRIDSEPAVFKERIRQEYPFLTEKKTGQLLVPEEIAKALPFAVGKPALDFISLDRNWTISLTNDFLALSSKDYERWERFTEHLRLPFETLLDVYFPAFFT